jgi:4-oxalocrotonate tautomerase
MPLIQVKLIENVFTPTQKKEIITKLTDAMVAIEGENLRSVTWVIVEEVRSGDLGDRRPGNDHGRGAHTDYRQEVAGPVGNSRRRQSHAPAHGALCPVKPGDGTLFNPVFEYRGRQWQI